MQPYFLPYLGYFHLLDSVDLFVVLEDVKYPKKGRWVNRNRILINGQPAWITVPVSITGELISEVDYRSDSEFFTRLRKTLSRAYSKAENLSSVFSYLQRWENSSDTGVSEVNMSLVRMIADLISMKIPKFINSSDLDLDKRLRGQNRILEICRILGADTYVNLPGGRNLYDQDAFLQVGTSLKFIKSNLRPYPQKTASFIPGLSVLDFVLSQNLELSKWCSDSSAYSLEAPN